MIRTVNIHVTHLTARKQAQIDALCQAYRAAVNFYIQSLWETPGKLDKQTLDRLPLEKTRLSARYRGSALKQALGIVISTRRALKATKKWGTCPVYIGNIPLCSMFVDIQPGRGSFDYVLRLATLNSGHRTLIPFNSHRRLNHWLKQPGAQLKNACQLNERGIKLFVELPDLPPVSEGRIIGVDAGMHKLIMTSDNSSLGTEFKVVSSKLRRRRPGSRNFRQTLTERNQLINRTVNGLPWSELKVIGMEDLKNLKRGKKASRGKAFRKALAPWTYAKLLNRIEVKALENRVLPVRVPPAYSSQECPTCGMVSKLNRRGESFACVRCSYTADADYVGAVNILARTLQITGSLQPPVAPNQIPSAVVINC